MITELEVKIVVSSTSEEAIKYAQIALDNQLYVEGWSLKGILRELIDYRAGKVALAYIGELPVGVGICHYDFYYGKDLVAAYVMPSHRNLGTGSRLVSNFASNQKAVAHLGIACSEHFWQKNAIKVDYF